MNKKIFSKIIMAALVISLMTGCSIKGAQTKTTESLPPEDSVTTGSDTQGEVIDVDNETQGQGFTVNQIKFEVVDASTLPEEIAEEIDTLKLQRGYEYWAQEDGSFLILVSAGEKMTGGYEIAVEAIEDNEGKTIISVKETEPSGDMNAEMITYPYVVVKASGITDNFIVSDQNQAAYDRISGKDGQTAADADQNLRYDPRIIDYSKPIEGIYQGLTDDQTIEMLVGDVQVAFSGDNIAKLLGDIEVGDTIRVTASIAPTDQILVDSIEKVQ